MSDDFAAGMRRAAEIVRDMFWHIPSAGEEVASAILAAIPAPAPWTPPTERIRHVKRGSTYEVVARGKIQTDTPLTDYAEVVVCRGEADGLVWVRQVGEFEDGRFAPLPPAPEDAP